MHLAETRFIRLNGPQVELLAANDDEARHALKELRHKKREFRLVKRRLTRERKALAAAEKERRQLADLAYVSPLSYVTRSLGAVVDFVISPGARPKVKPRSTKLGVDAQLEHINETLLNLDEAILHVTGRLMAQS